MTDAPVSPAQAARDLLASVPDDPMQAVEQLSRAREAVDAALDEAMARAALEGAYADLIPVIDGGIAIDTLETGGMRGATRRVQTVTPERPCLACSGQINMSEVALEMSGDLDDPEYIRRAGRESISGRPNVAALCAAVSGSQLEQFVSLVAQPGGRGAPWPLRFSLAAHHLEHLPQEAQPYCPTEGQLAAGNQRADLCRTTGSWTNQHMLRLTVGRRISKLFDRWIELALNS
jgi:hypothetical protein